MKLTITKSWSLLLLSVFLLVAVGTTTYAAGKAQAVKREPSLTGQAFFDWLMPNNNHQMPLAKASSHHSKPIPLIKRTYHLPPFSTITIDYDINVTAKASQSHQSVVAFGSPKAVACFNPRVEDDHLYITYKYHGGPPCENVTVHIKMKHLAQIYHHGSGNVYINNVHSRFLNAVNEGPGSLVVKGSNIGLKHLATRGNGYVYIGKLNTNYLDINSYGDAAIYLPGKANLVAIRFEGNGSLNIPNATSSPMRVEVYGSPTIKIDGVIQLTRLKVKGCSPHIEMHWVKCETCSITADHHAYIRLAGIADVLHANLDDEAHLDSRYLRGRIEFIQTDWKAQADVYPVQTLYAYARWKSNIYYYYDPKTIPYVVKRGGSILPMYDIPSALLTFNRAPHTVDETQYWFGARKWRVDFGDY